MLRVRRRKRSLTSVSPEVGKGTAIRKLKQLSVKS